MIRFVFRFLGLVTLAAAFIFFVYDGTKSIAGNEFFYVTSFHSLWTQVDQQSLLQAQERMPAWMWDPWISTVLQQPAWLVMLVLGAILTLLGRKKKPLIGYSR